MKKIFLFITVSLILISTTNAQKQVSEFLNLGLNDANKIAGAYLKPYGEMLGVNLNSGWYTSAKVHKIGGFDITFSASFTTVPDVGKTYDISKLNLTSWSPSNANNIIAPTMSSSMDDIPSLVNNSNSNLTLDLPNGSKKASYMLSPMIQAGIGLPYHTEIMGRFMPKATNRDYGMLQLWGIGIKHSIKDYIPVFKRLPALQLSILGGYTNFSGNLSLPQNNVFNDGDLSIGTTAITSRLLIGANLPAVAFYAGLGYGSTKSNFDVSGNYSGEIGGAQEGKLLALEYKTSGFDMNVGMRVRIGIIGIHADYTVGDYSIVTAGIGINFR